MTPGRAVQKVVQLIPEIHIWPRDLLERPQPGAKPVALQSSRMEHLELGESEARRNEPQPSAGWHLFRFQSQIKCPSRYGAAAAQNYGVQSAPDNRWPILAK